MRNVSSRKKSSRPRICAAVDYAIEESGKTNQQVADALTALGHPVSGQNVGRWRKNIVPDRDTVELLETFLGATKEPGWISAIAGYNRPISQDDLFKIIDNTDLFSDGYRRIVKRVVQEAIDGTADDRAEQEAFRAKTAAATRRSRRT